MRKLESIPYLVNTGPGNTGLKTNVFWIWGGFCVIGFVYAYLLIPETKRLSLDQVYVLYRNSTPRGSAAYRQILSPQISDVAVETAHDDGEVESEQMEAEQMEAGTSANAVRQLWLTLWERGEGERIGTVQESEQGASRRVLVIDWL